MTAWTPTKRDAGLGAFRLREYPWNWCNFYWTPNGEHIYHSERDTALALGSRSASPVGPKMAFTGAQGARFPSPTWTHWSQNGPNAANLSGFAPYGEWTIMAVGQAGVTTGPSFFIYMGDSTVTNKWVILQLSSGGVFMLSIATGGASQPIVNADPFPKGEWHVLVGTCQRVSATVSVFRLFIDGVPVNKKTYFTAASTFDRVTVGRLDRSAPTNSNQCHVAQAAIFGKALKFGDVVQISADPWEPLRRQRIPAHLVSGSHIRRRSLTRR